MPSGLKKVTNSWPHRSRTRHCIGKLQPPKFGFVEAWHSQAANDPSSATPARETRELQPERDGRFRMVRRAVLHTE